MVRPLRLPSPVASPSRRTYQEERHALRHLVAQLVPTRRRRAGSSRYALLVALIAIVAVAAVTAAGLKVDAIFDEIVAQLP